MSININFERCIHSNDAQTTDDFRRIGDLLRTKEQSILVPRPIRVKMVKPLGAKTDRRGSSEIKFSRIEKFKKGILKYLGPYLDLFKWTSGQPTNDGVGDVSNAGLEREKGFGETACFDFFAEEINKMGSDGFAFVGLGCILACVVRMGALNDGYNTVGVNRDRGGPDSV